jgi:hypothetical protein
MKDAEGDAYVMNRTRQLYTHGLRLLLSTAAALLLGLSLLIVPGPAQAASAPLGASKEAPSAAAQPVYDYWAAIDRHDYPAAYAQFTAAYRQDHGFERFALTHWSSVQHAGNVQILHEDAVEGRLAMTAQVDLVPGVISPYPAGANTFVYTLVEENGVWRIAHMISSVEEVAVTPPAPAPAAGVEVFVLLGVFAALFGAMTVGALLHSDRVR